MPYTENPKTEGSGIVCAIPQRGTCPHRCADCFFQSGRSYLEPLAENLPNMPPPDVTAGRVVRVNDGNDSNVNRKLVEAATAHYPDRFYNTSLPRLGFPAPAVLTVNPGEMTDVDFYRNHLEPGLMFVRVRVNAWNRRTVVPAAVRHYRSLGASIALTFMAYFTEAVPKSHTADYVWRSRTLNSYWCLRESTWRSIMREYPYSTVWSCSGPGPSLCRHCGACLREYYAAKERMRK